MKSRLSLVSIPVRCLPKRVTTRYTRILAKFRAIYNRILKSGAAYMRMKQK